MWELHHVFFCTNCPVVSVVSQQTGCMFDLGNITIAEVMMPPQEQDHLFVAVPAAWPLHGRRDS
jgi:hypothetical protein